MPKTPRTLSEFQLEFTVSFQYIEIFEQGNVSRDVPKKKTRVFSCGPKCGPKSRPATGRATDTIKFNVKHSIIDQIVNRDFEYLLYQVLNV